MSQFKSQSKRDEVVMHAACGKFEVLQRRCLYDVVGPPNDVLLMIVLFLFL